MEKIKRIIQAWLESSVIDTILTGGYTEAWWNFLDKFGHSDGCLCTMRQSCRTCSRPRREYKYIPSPITEPIPVGTIEERRAKAQEEYLNDSYWQSWRKSTGTSTWIWHLYGGCL